MDRPEFVYTEAPSNVNRGVAVYSVRAERTFPAPRTYEFVGDVYENSDRFVGAPWFDVLAFRDGPVISCYVRYGYLPDGIPVIALTYGHWNAFCVFNDQDLRQPSDRQLVTARRRMMRALYWQLYRFEDNRLLDARPLLDVWYDRHRNEYQYALRLSAISDGQLAAWSGNFGVDQHALCYTRPLLRREFRFTRKESEFWVQHCRFERRVRSANGFLVPYQQLEFNEMRGNARHARYVSVNDLWRRIEVPRGCNVGVPFCLTYIGSQLYGSTESGFWVVLYSEFAANVAAFLLWEAYDHYRVWALSPTLIGFIRRLDLTRVLGTRADADKMLQLLEFIERTNWSLHYMVIAPHKSWFSHDFIMLLSMICSWI